MLSEGRGNLVIFIPCYNMNLLIFLSHFSYYVFYEYSLVLILNKMTKKLKWKRPENKLAPATKAKCMVGSV
jgi:hypothetical protein